MKRGQEDKLHHTVTISLVKQANYCPMIPWLEENLTVKPPTTPSMELGKVQENLEETADLLGLPQPRLYHTCLHDPTTGLRGCPDIIAGEKWRIVVEVKRFSRSPSQSIHFLQQARAYAVLVNNTLGRVRYYILVLGEQVIEKPLTPEDIEETTRQARRVHKLLYKPPLNAEPDARKCSYCEYQPACPLNAARGKSGLILV